MTLPSHLSPTILAATVNQIAPMYLADAQGDEQAARDAVTALLADYKPQTNEELTLAADMVHYRLLARHNLKRSFDPELPETKVLRLHGSAVSLSREAHKAQRKLDRLQAARTVAMPARAAQPEPTRPDIARPQTALSETTRPETVLSQTAPLQTAPSPAADPGHAAPPTPAELAALQAARKILNGKKPINTGGYGGHNASLQLRKRLMVQTMNENAARRAAEHASRTAGDAAAPVA